MLNMEIYHVVTKLFVFDLHKMTSTSEVLPPRETSNSDA
jgi:hypothetical protein